MLRDHIRPLKHHCSGIPKNIRDALNQLQAGDKRYLESALELYEKLAKQLESYEKLGDARCPVEREEQAAEIFAHQIVDLAFIHNAIASSGYQIGDFPYNDLADKIFDKAEAESENDSNSGL